MSPPRNFTTAAAIVALVAIAPSCRSDESTAAPTTIEDAAPSTKQPAFITREYAETNGGIRPCGPRGQLSPEALNAYNEGTTTVPIQQRNYTLDHAKSVHETLSHQPIDDNAEVQINYSSVGPDGYLELGLIVRNGNSADRELELFDNYRLPPPLEMYCYSAGASTW